MSLLQSLMKQPNKPYLAFSFILRVALVIALISAILTWRWTIVFLCSVALILSFLPAIIRRNLKVYLPSELEITIVVFIFLAVFLGEVHDYYQKFWWWDIVLHSTSGIVLGFLGFLIMFVLYDQGKINARPFIIALFSFCFAVALGTVWEIFEFFIDLIIGPHMQRGAIDTMGDLILNTGGSLITSILGYLYLKGGKTRIFEKLMDDFKLKNPELFKK